MGLNLRGAVAGLGRGLVALGQQGFEEQQRATADARLSAREQAMAALNHDYRTQEANDSSKREINQYEANTPGVVAREAAVSRNVRIPERQVEGRITRETADHNSARDYQEQLALLNARDRVDFNRWRQQHNIEQGDIRSLDTWRQQNGIGADANRVPQQRRNGSTGNYDEYRNGAWTDTGVRFPVSGGDDGLGLDDPPASGGGAPAPTGRGGRPVLAAPRPAARGADTPPIAGARRGADGHWYVTRGGRNFLVQGN